MQQPKAKTDTKKEAKYRTKNENKEQMTDIIEKNENENRENTYLRTTQKTGARILKQKEQTTTEDTARKHQETQTRNTE